MLRTAAGMFSTRGFHGTTLVDIATQLHITKPALYHYFASKDEILIECTRMGLAAVEAAFEEATLRGATGRVRLEAFMTWYAENMTTVYGACFARVAEQDLGVEARKELRDAKRVVDRRFCQLIEAGIADGSVAPCDVKLAAFTLAGALSFIGHWYKPGGRWTSREAAEGVVKQLVAGLAVKGDSARSEDGRPVR
ncbi:MAG TPA: TetR/AcrR family transcriptional regulator [Polyangiaceae bacterium]|nr:TetR/AcrR family transcriptional regulator [Polyangiaceae bacterium]